MAFGRVESDLNWEFSVTCVLSKCQPCHGVTDFVGSNPTSFMDTGKLFQELDLRSPWLLFLSSWHASFSTFSCCPELDSYGNNDDDAGQKMASWWLCGLSVYKIQPKCLKGGRLLTKATLFIPEVSLNKRIWALETVLPSRWKQNRTKSKWVFQQTSRNQNRGLKGPGFLFSSCCNYTASGNRSAAGICLYLWVLTYNIH